MKLRSGMQSLDELNDTAVHPQSSLTAPISMLELLRILRRHKRMILGGTGAFVLLGFALSLLLPNKYTAVTTILPPQQGSSMSAALLAQISQLGGLGSLASMAGGSAGIKNQGELYISLLKSRTVEDSMVERFDLRSYYGVKRASDARKLLQEHCNIEIGAKDGLIKISVEDKSPAHSAEMANAYVEEYRRFSAGLAVSEASQRRIFFEQQLSEAKGNLSKAEESLKQTEITTGMIHLDSQARALIESVSSLRAQITAAEVRIRALSLFSTASNPELLLAQQQLAALQEQFKRLTGEKDRTEGDLILSRAKVPQAGLEYVRRLRDVKYFETIFEVMAKQYEAAKIDEAKQGSVIQVIDSAVIPDKKSSPRPLIIIPVLFFVGLCSSIAWCLAKETWILSKGLDSLLK